MPRLAKKIPTSRHQSGTSILTKASKPKTKAEHDERLKKILAGLDKLYPNVTCALDHSNAWELLAATILSAQCTDKRVNMVTPGLFRKYPTIQDFASASQKKWRTPFAPPAFTTAKPRASSERPASFSPISAARFRRTLKTADRSGAARKTANVVLGTVYGIASGVVVGTHVQRISQRLDLTKNRTSENRARPDERSFPKAGGFNSAADHPSQRGPCVARKPKCAECGITDLCYAPDKTI